MIKIQEALFIAHFVLVKQSTQDQHSSLLFHILLTSQYDNTERCKYVLYIFLS